ncbi:MAG: hypothetical protein E7029_07055 [Planctomycetaceae bacterium]|nr:hypothetical protein [Planctomycetaceae bacterium]
MSKVFRGLALLALVMLAGCDELKDLTQNTETETEGAPAVVNARVCHIARIGSLANLSEDIWDAAPGTQTGTPETQETLDPALPHSTLMSSENFGHVGENVDDDVLKIVESAVEEAASNGGIQAAGTGEEADDLEFAVEIVDEDAAPSARKKREGNVRAQNGGRMLVDSDEAENLEDAEEAEEVEDAEGTEDIEDAEETEDAEDAKGAEDGEEMMEIAVGPAVEEEAEDAEETEELGELDALEETDSEEIAGSEDELGGEMKAGVSETDELEPVGNDRDAMEERLEDEVESQAEEFVALLKNVPDEIREEVRKHNFQNLSFRVVKLPGSLIFGKTAPEYYVIRTMEYTGSALSHDYQALHLSPSYMKWQESLEKYLDTMALDENNHEIWVEAPEYWNSEAE